MNLRRGFTLMELLVATLLATALLALLWQLLGTYEGLYTRGQGKADESQLARGILDQMGEDLRGAISDSPVGAGAAGSVRRFGLFGTERAMQIDVLQFPAEVVAEAYASDPDRRALAASPLAASGLEAGGLEAGGVRAGAFGSGRDTARGAKQAPELRTVQYVFTAPNDSETESGEGFVGLVRREMDWEPADESESRSRGGSLRGAKPSAATGAASGVAGRSAVSPRAGSLTGEGAGPGRDRGRTDSKARRSTSAIDPAALDLDELPLDSPTVARFPEVVELRLRYFDGTGWSSEWNSLQRRSLPVAVEITLRTQPPGTRREERRTTTSAPGFGGATRSDTSTSDGAARSTWSAGPARSDAISRSSDTKSPDATLPLPAGGGQTAGAKTVPASSTRSVEPVTRRMLVYLPGNALKPPERPSGERYSISERWMAKRAARPVPQAAARAAAPSRPQRIRPSGTPGATTFSDQWMRTVP